VKKHQTDFSNLQKSTMTVYLYLYFCKCTSTCYKSDFGLSWAFHTRVKDMYCRDKRTGTVRSAASYGGPRNNSYERK